MAVVRIVLTSADVSPWVPPSDFSGVADSVVLVGAGAGGAAGKQSNSTTVAGGGGGGQSLTLTNFSIASSVAFVVGIHGNGGTGGGNGANGGTTTFGSFIADSGKGGTQTAGGAGGSTATNPGSVATVRNGGNGGSVGTPSADSQGGGGGGGGAGSTAAGANGGSSSFVGASGGGGGGGSAGSNDTSSGPGGGGNGSGGTGAGAPATVNTAPGGNGAAGGGGGGGFGRVSSFGSNGGNGGNGTNLEQGGGGGGGGGGTKGASNVPGNGGVGAQAGGGGGGAGNSNGTATLALGGNGGDGVIVITYTTVDKATVAVTGQNATSAVTLQNGPSPDNTSITTSGPTVVDISGNVWSISGDGHVIENGVIQTTGSPAAMVLLLYFGGAMYGKNSAGTWYTTGAPWTIIAGDPRDRTVSIARTLANATANVVASTVVSFTASIARTLANATASVSAFNQPPSLLTIAKTADNATANVSAMQSYAATITGQMANAVSTINVSNQSPYTATVAVQAQNASANIQASFSGSNAITIARSLANATANVVGQQGASANNTQVVDTTGIIVDSTGKLWALSADGHVLQGGVVQTTGSPAAMVLLVYWNSAVYGKNANGTWYTTGAPWVIVGGDPRANNITINRTMQNAVATAYAFQECRFFGINTHFGYTTSGYGTTTDAHYVSIFKDLGTNIIRSNINNLTKANQVLHSWQAMYANDIQVLCVIDSGISLTATYTQNYNSAFTIGNQIAGVMKNNGVTYYECSNEYDFNIKYNNNPLRNPVDGSISDGSIPTDFDPVKLEALRGWIVGCAAGIKSTQPNAKTGWASGVAFPQTLKKLLNDGTDVNGNVIHPPFIQDFDGVHFYNTEGQITSASSSHRGSVNSLAELKAISNSPIHVTEWGIKTTEAGQATYIASQMAFWWAQKNTYNISAVYLYALFADSDDSGTGTGIGGVNPSNYGVVWSDYSIKSGYTALQHFIDVNDPTPVTDKFLTIGGRRLANATASVQVVNQSPAIITVAGQAADATANVQVNNQFPYAVTINRTLANATANVVAKEGFSANTNITAGDAQAAIFVQQGPTVGVIVSVQAQNARAAIVAKELIPGTVNVTAQNATADVELLSVFPITGTISVTAQNATANVTAITARRRHHIAILGPQ